MKINIIGNIFGSSGYDIHTRSIANALHQEGAEVRIDCPKPDGWQRNVNDAELVMLKREFDEEYISIMIGTPPFWKFGIADNPKKFIGYLVWEGDKIPTYWLEYLLDTRVDEIWVPSQHTKDAIINTLNFEEQPNSDFSIQKKIKIIPHGVDLSLFSPAAKKEKRPFTFVCNKGWRGGMEDRGGIQYALKAFSEEFTDDEDVRLIIKLNPSYLGPKFNLKQELERINVPPKDNIFFNTTEVIYQALPEFYRQGDVFVSATRAEGFGLTGLEAQACGLPTIQTGYGGQIDYMSKDFDAYIKYELEEVKGDINYEGIKWAIPSIEHLKSLMREFYEHREMKIEPLDRSEWSWRKSAKKALKYLGELDK